MNTRPLRVLLVDDERTVADTLAMIFFEKGYDSRAVYSAEHALEMVEEWPPDLAILDVVLPKMHGIDLALQLTQRSLNCRILLLSGQAVTDDLLAEAKMNGLTFTVLAKPIHPVLLLNKASEALTSNNKNSA